jgi:hypothetical protein
MCGCALRFHLAHDDLTRYNAVQRTLYVAIILVGILQVIGSRRLEADAVLGADDLLL